jgi:transcriptional regulator with XRE-family HTH domain
MRKIGVTQEKLAEALDMTQGGVQHWLSGTRQPSLEDINRIAAILKVAPAWLTHGLEPDDMLDGLGEPARQTLRRLIHAERAAPLPEAIWNIVKSAADVAQPEPAPALTPTVQRVLEAGLTTESRDLYRQGTSTDADRPL